MHLRQTKRLLQAWGRYQAAREGNRGATKSISAVAIEIGRVGIYARGTATEFDPDAPDDFRAVNEAVERLSSPRMLAIRARYVMRGKWERNARMLGVTHGDLQAAERLVQVYL
ncbi:MAG: hypothetical protein ACLFVU_02000 [Phycisphaerae bacterium]